MHTRSLDMGLAAGKSAGTDIVSAIHDKSILKPRSINSLHSDKLS